MFIIKTLSLKPPKYAFFLFPFSVVKLSWIFFLHEKPEEKSLLAENSVRITS